MGRTTKAYADARGRLHADPETATLHDLAAMLGSAPNDTVIARVIFTRREAIERLFEEHDQMIESGGESTDGDMFDLVPHRAITKE